MKSNEDKRNKESRLSSLYAQKSKLTIKLQKLQEQKSETEKQIGEVEKKLAGIMNGIQYLEERTILITTHFIDRYHERVGPGTEDEIRAHIVTPQLENMVRTLGNGAYPVDPYNVVVEDFKLITILSPTQKITGYGQHVKDIFKSKRRNNRNGKAKGRNKGDRQ